MATPSMSLDEQRRRQSDHSAARAAHHANRATQSRPRRDNATLRAIAEAAEQRFTAGDGREVLAWVAEEFGYSTAVACSMADAVLPAVVAEALPWVDTLFLDTGYHFPETIGTRDAVEATMQLTIVDVRPLQSVAEQDATHGKDLFSSDPGACCQLRKVEPLTRTLAQYEVWITGVRRDEGPTRAETPLVSWDDKNGLVKVNPLAFWTFDDVLGYAAEHNILVNPLLSDGYPSIGCQPCTRRVAPGEDPRSGRWSGFEKTECGLHT